MPPPRGCAGFWGHTVGGSGGGLSPDRRRLCPGVRKVAPEGHGRGPGHSQGEAGVDDPHDPERPGEGQPGGQSQHAVSVDEAQAGAPQAGWGALLSPSCPAQRRAASRGHRGAPGGSGGPRGQCCSPTPAPTDTQRAALASRGRRVCPPGRGAALGPLQPGTLPGWAVGPARAPSGRVPTWHLPVSQGERSVPGGDSGPGENQGARQIRGQ